MANNRYEGDYPTVSGAKATKTDVQFAPPSKIVAKDVMAHKIITTQPEASVLDVVALLFNHKISGMPVIDEKQHLVGIISEKDTFKLILHGGYTQSLAGKVSDYMSTKVKTVSPDDDIFMIANLFYENNFRRLPVVENDKVVGVISRRDILKAIQSLGH